MSKVTLVVTGTVVDADQLAAYKKVAVQVLQKHGAEFPPRAREVTTVLAGELIPKMYMEIDFPEEQNVLNAFTDPDYLSVITQRDQAFSNLSIYVTR